MKENTEITRQTALDEGEMEIDLVELLYYFYGHILWILAALLAGGALMGLVTFFFITPKYTATSKVYMVSSNTDSVLDLSDLNLGTSLSKDYAEVLTSRPILEEVSDTLGLGYTYEQIDGMVEVTSVTETRILVINAESYDPTEAKNIANSLARLAVSRLPVLMGTMEPSLIESAITPEEPSSPSYVRNIMIGALLLAVLVMALLTFRFVSDDTLKTTEDVEAAFGVMPLAVIPEGEMEGLNGKEEKKKGRKRAGKKSRLTRKGKGGGAGGKG